MSLCGRAPSRGRERGGFVLIVGFSEGKPAGMRPSLSAKQELVQQIIPEFNETSHSRTLASES